MSRNRPLTDKELLDLIEAGLSDIEGLSDGEFNEDDGFDFDPEAMSDEEEEAEPVPSTPVTQQREETEQLEQAEPKPVTNIMAKTPQTSKKSNIEDYLENNGLSKKKDIFWRKNVQYITPPIEWHVSEDEPTDIFQPMMEYTNLYAVQQQTRFVPTTVEELKTFVGIHIIMGNLHYPRIKLYWDHKLQIPLISNNMTVNRFYKLRQHIHFVNIHEKPDNSDRFWKVRPLYDAIRRRCLSLPFESKLCVDEQMVPFKGSLNVKQYVKNKPKPWGIKNFALCGSSGILYDFIIYQGSTTELDSQQLDVFGSGAAVVLKLSERISHPRYLRNRQIYTTCTARAERFKNSPFSSDKDMKIKGRGCSEEIISGDNGRKY
ncbi:piggyBac transposable element-derived protein 3-like [Anthonomus grandis grandis]|uniref:piggyBac transposable element-derived protein 3-like n=1 Tax=Anthonomus grandis grandis TaxID=2921223 RepID=UPI0021667E16|nr:piggyBac transposable element-derived protein 3-like [Anthonomus grandis grandis]